MGSTALAGDHLKKNSLLGVGAWWTRLDGWGLKTVRASEPLITVRF